MADRMIVNTTRILHAANFVLWLVNGLTWAMFAHSSFMAASSFAGAALSLWLARKS